MMKKEIFKTLESYNASCLPRTCTRIGRDSVIRLCMLVGMNIREMSDHLDIPKQKMSWLVKKIRENKSSVSII